MRPYRCSLGKPGPGSWWSTPEWWLPLGPRVCGAPSRTRVRGSGNIAHGAAMSRPVAGELIERGIALAEELAAGGVGIVAVGDMGIANTTAASAVCAALLPADPADVCGPGTGLDGPGVERKVEVVRAALRANDLGECRGTSDPIGALASVGGLEIAFLTGVMLGGLRSGSRCSWTASSPALRLSWRRVSLRT